MKIIKKFNILFASILLIGVTVAVFTFLWSTRENIDFDRSATAGHAKLMKNSDQREQVPNEVSAQAVEGETVLLNASESDHFEGTETESTIEDKQMADIKEGREKARFSFIAIGDSESYTNHTGHKEELETVLSQAKEHKPDFTIFTGDIIITGDASIKGNESRISNVKHMIEKYFNNYYIAFGQHDIECGKDCIDSWKKIFFDFTVQTDEDRKLYYSFDYLNTHFVLLSTDYPEERSVDQAQLSWLEKDLGSNSQPNTIVVQHIPPVTFFKKSARKCHDLSCVPHVRNKLLSLYRKYNVDCVISGHEHAFDHKIVDGIDFVLSGNTGNKPKYKGVIKGNIYSHFSIDGEKIMLKAINTENKLIREINIK
ncbi:MAG: metallophosphoesterase [Patescibacteria group bacterium]|nr:metallophosphoesterase [Patescibacteria group bacterium]